MAYFETRARCDVTEMRELPQDELSPFLSSELKSELAKSMR